MKIILDMEDTPEEKLGYIDKQQLVVSLIKRHCKTNLLIKNNMFLAGINAVAHALVEERTLK